VTLFLYRPHYFCCVNKVVLMYLHDKCREVCIKARIQRPGLLAHNCKLVYSKNPSFTSITTFKWFGSCYSDGPQHSLLLPILVELLPELKIGKEFCTDYSSLESTEMKAQFTKEPIIKCMYFTSKRFYSRKRG